MQRTLARTEGKAERTVERPWVKALFRLGMVAKAVLYAVIGVLAIGVALDIGGRTTDAAGALETLADEPFGTALLVVLAVGLLGYAAWRLAQALIDIDDKGADAKAIVARAGYFVSGAIHLALMALAIRLLVDSKGASGSGGSAGSGGGQEAETTAGVLDWPGGRAIVIAAAVVIIGVGVYNVVEGVTKRFMERMSVSGRAREIVENVALVGLVARGAVFGLIGWFLMKAAIEYDPNEAVGLDGALGRLANQPYGQALLAAAAAGLVAYAFYCVAQARYRQI